MKRFSDHLLSKPTMPPGAIPRETSDRAAPVTVPEVAAPFAATPPAAAPAASASRWRAWSPYRFVKFRWHVLCMVIDTVGWLAVLAARAVRRACGRCDGMRDADPRAILLVQLDHLGDAVLSTPLLAALRARYPQARLEVLAAPWNREVFDQLAEVDRVHVSRINRFGRGWRLAGRAIWPLAMLGWGWRLRRRRFDLAIDPRGELPSAIVMWLAGAARRVGWRCGGGGFLLTQHAAYVPGRAELESRRALLDLLNVPTPSGHDFRPRLSPPAAAERRVARRLQLHDVAARPLIVLHVGAGTLAKRWPRERWEELLGRIALEFAPQVVLVGTADDTPFVRAITGQQAWPNVLDWTGRLSVSELAALIARADLFVGGDSGPAHLAAAVGTPAVVLFSGATDPGIWQPRGERVIVLRHEVPCSPCHAKVCPLAHHACMQGLEPTRVIAAMQRLQSRETAAEPLADLAPLPDVQPLLERLP